MNIISIKFSTKIPMDILYRHSVNWFELYMVRTTIVVDWEEVQVRRVGANNVLCEEKIFFKNIF